MRLKKCVPGESEGQRTAAVMRDIRGHTLIYRSYGLTVEKARTNPKKLTRPLSEIGIGSQKAFWNFALEMCPSNQAYTHAGHTFTPGIFY